MVDVHIDGINRHARCGDSAVCHHEDVDPVRSCEPEETSWKGDGGIFDEARVPNVVDDIWEGDTDRQQSGDRYSV